MPRRVWCGTWAMNPAPRRVRRRRLFPDGLFEDLFGPRGRPSVLDHPLSAGAAAQLDHPLSLRLGGAPRAVTGPARSVPHARFALAAVAVDPLACCLVVDLEPLRRRGHAPAVPTRRTILRRWVGVRAALGCWGRLVCAMSSPGGGRGYLTTRILPQEITHQRRQANKTRWAQSATQDASATHGRTRTPPAPQDRDQPRPHPQQRRIHPVSPRGNAARPGPHRPQHPTSPNPADRPRRPTPPTDPADPTRHRLPRQLLSTLLGTGNGYTPTFLILA